ncbi:tail assembly chaperone [Weissella cibaria]|uniref:tail assembly chaperone n=1 Tax=Weissella cibaria TaxID=137591 RepID=UPI000E4B9663|nr:tail assembly chaperone [Weissella cibaria]RHE74178.1 hypothetical protein DW718_02835 [Weissella cibaria]RHE76308.1 hypothetical protein DW717_09315 [Weissella cibaria]TVV37875.1 hypothetical protein FO437_03880 [Weissella cibaria]
MAIELDIKGKQVTGKFNFGAFYKANKLLSNEQNNDGAVNLFYGIVTGDLMMLPSAITILAPTNAKLTDEQLGDAVDALTAAHGGDLDAVFDAIKEELQDSGFFVKAVKNQIKSMEMIQEALMAKEDTTEVQKKAFEEMLSTLQENV